MAPLPIALCGKHPSMAAEFIKLMQPEYDVVHVCHTAPTAKSELPPLLAGQHTIPSSEKGSNVNSPNPQIPKAVFVGGGFSQMELDEMREVEALRNVPWLYAAPKVRPGMAGPPPMDMIVKRVKEVFAEKGFVKGKEDGVEVGLWEY